MRIFSLTLDNISIAPTLHLSTSKFSVSIMGIVRDNIIIMTCARLFNFQEPTNFISSTVSIQSSSPDSDSCEESVVNQMTSGRSPVIVMDTPSCRYAGRRVTYCLQFRTDECQSNVTTETVECKVVSCTMVSYSSLFSLLVPGLLSSVHHIRSSISEIVSILVNVDEQTNCDGVEGLTITATLSDRNMIISTQQTNYSDTAITFESISAGDYTCSVTVEDETGPVESVHIPCTVDEGE